MRGGGRGEKSEGEKGEGRRRRELGVFLMEAEGF